MEITVDLPDTLARDLRFRDTELSRRILESVALDAYREGRISQGKLGEILGMGFAETEDFLNARAIPMPYDVEDLDRDAQSNAQIAVE